MLNLNPAALMDAMPVVLYGMGGIFIVIGVIMLTVVALSIAVPESEE
jgi:hypothetical protein